MTYSGVPGLVTYPLALQTLLTFTRVDSATYKAGSTSGASADTDTLGVCASGVATSEDPGTRLCKEFEFPFKFELLNASNKQ